MPVGKREGKVEAQRRPGRRVEERVNVPGSERKGRPTRHVDTCIVPGTFAECFMLSLI